ncbi:potassium transporter TrkG [Verrucomicrobium sp. BvORR106]|uniref:TrkH family potassium uptake protein n=1 Tax=Verrucomicrobium sp. BvORR106 TaxID=1403819 RepID=UPI00056FBE84|nr:potassium transporter TrkG [Verrucomicrobium sp. BvORR106]
MSAPSHQKDSSIPRPLPPARPLPRLFALTLGCAALALLVLQVGFVGEVTPVLHGATVLLSFLFALEQILTWLSRRHLQAWARRETLLLAVALTVFGVTVFLALAAWMGGKDARLSLLAHTAVQSVILGVLSLRGLRHQARLTAITLRPGWLLIGSFLFLIVAGTVLLKLPRAVVPGEHLSWLNALFMSTSAVCVTGLTVENPATYFTPTGQIILLALMQIGGLGIMTLTFFMAAIVFQGISLHDHLLLGEMIAEKRLAHVGETLKFIVLFTAVCEAAGAVALFLVLPAEASVDARIYHAVYHSVSAFCNAGMSTLPNNLAEGVLRHDILLQLVICVLVALGGIGSMTAFDTLRFMRSRVACALNPTLPRPRLRVHTRIVLLTTAILIVGGAVAVYVSEFLLHDGQSNGGSGMTAFFHSITARSGGFNTVDMAKIGPVTIHVMVFLMFVGGSPGSTAGGVRTTVFAVAALHLWNQIRGIPQIVVFRRRLPDGIGARALGVIVFSSIWLFVNFAVLRQLQPDVTDTALVFELVSAFATVGLSLNLTPELTDAAKGLIILNMFVGRIGLLTLITTFMPRARKPLHTHPQEDILLA